MHSGSFTPYTYTTLLLQQGFISPYSALLKKVSRCILKVYSASFGVDVKPLVPRDLVYTGSCLLQALFSHHCGQPLRGNETNKQTNTHTHAHTQYILTTFPTEHTVLALKVGTVPPLRPITTPTAPATSTRELTLKGGWMSACGHKHVNTRLLVLHDIQDCVHHFPVNVVGEQYNYNYTIQFIIKIGY